MSSHLTKAIASVITDPSTASTKRLAWAYGCAKKGSSEERQLGEILRARIQAERAS